MSTRSTVAMKTEDGLVGMYVHWDGYPTGNGQILKDSYDNDAKVAELIALGDLSKLGSEIGQPQYDTSIKRAEGTPELELFDDYCLAYNRDRGESWNDVSPRTFDDVKQWVDDFAESWCEYFYLWNGADWLVSNGKHDENGFPVFDFIDVAIMQQQAENVQFGKIKVDILKTWCYTKL